MSGLKSKRKGERGENELARKLGAFLDEDIKRTLGQAREGGADITSVPGLCIEVKRHETLSIKSWWEQVQKAAPGQDIPVLAYRQNRRPWNFCLPSSLIGVRGDGFITLSETVFIEWMLTYLDTLRR